jgi:hypothetical protein
METPGASDLLVHKIQLGMSSLEVLHNLPSNPKFDSCYILFDLLEHNAITSVLATSPRREYHCGDPTLVSVPSQHVGLFLI